MFDFEISITSIIQNIGWLLRKPQEGFILVVLHVYTNHYQFLFKNHSTRICPGTNFHQTKGSSVEFCNFDHGGDGSYHIETHTHTHTRPLWTLFAKDKIIMVLIHKPGPKPEPVSHYIETSKNTSEWNSFLVYKGFQEDICDTTGTRESHYCDAIMGAMASQITGLSIVYSTCNTNIFYGHSLCWLRAWINDYMPSQMWDEITYPFPNFNCATVEVLGWISLFSSHFLMAVITYPCWD